MTIMCKISFSFYTTCSVNLWTDLEWVAIIWLLLSAGQVEMIHRHQLHMLLLP